MQMQTVKSKKLIIIPAYNESESILKTIEMVKKAAPDYDYIVINDCSKDNTREILVRSKVPYIDLPINLGIGGAVQTGYKYAADNGYQIAVQIDGDGQHDPGYLKAMEKAMADKGLDMVIGSRFIENEGFQSSRLRRLGISFFSRLIRLCTGHTITDPTSGLRMAGKKAIDLFTVNYPKDYPEPETVVFAIIQGCRIGEVPVVMNERQGGVSSINPGKSIYYMVKVSLAILMARFSMK